MCWFDSYDALHIEFDLDGNSCVFVPEGTVPGWAVDTETGNGEFSDIAGIWMEMRMQLAALRSTNKEIGHCLNALTVMTT